MRELVYRCSSTSFTYTIGMEKVEVLHNISFEVQKGELVCLSGPSGSGKSTLLNLMGLIEPIQKGDIYLKGKSLKNMNNKSIVDARKYDIGFIFQQFHLLEVLNAYENIEYFLARQGVPAKERKERIEKALNEVGLWDHRFKKPGQMSGGQRQRVAIARAFAKHPSIIIADEPTASLDLKTGTEIMEILADHCEKSGVTVITASHDPMVMDIAKRIISLRDGYLLSDDAKGGSADAS